MKNISGEINTNHLKIRKKAYLLLITSMISVWLILFLPAGTLMYWQAWVFYVVFFVPVIFVTHYFLSRNPDFIARRMKLREREGEQKIIVRIATLVYVIALLTPGFDFRFNWSSVPSALVIISDVIVFIGYLIVFFVFKENSFASRVVEVEQEQKVITTGPYAVVRHPMYSGAMLMYLFTPLALGSFWALIPFAALVPAFVLRALNEEKVLLRDLPGYDEYYRKTRYRIVPFVW